MKKLAFSSQLCFGCAIVFVSLACSVFFETPLLGNLGWVVCGLLFVCNPVYPARCAGLENIRLYTRLSGFLVIALGLTIRFGA